MTKKALKSHEVRRGTKSPEEGIWRAVVIKPRGY